jgi:hypothetical protein
MPVILSVLFWLYFFGATFVAFCPIAFVRLVLMPFDPAGRCAHWLTRWFSYHFIALNPQWHVRISAGTADCGGRHAQVASARCLDFKFPRTDERESAAATLSGAIRL